MAKKIDYHERLTTPFETGIRNFTTIARYFMYYAPNIESCHSIGRIEGDNATNIINTIKSQMNNKAKILKKIQPTSWSELDFDTDIVDFEYSRMLFDIMNNESELTALLRHLRNALAHGYIYVWRKEKKGDYILFVDYEKKKANKPQKVTAKIMVSMTILQSWKAILDNEIAIGE